MLTACMRCQSDTRGLESWDWEALEAAPSMTGNCREHAAHDMGAGPAKMLPAAGRSLYSSSVVLVNIWEVVLVVSAYCLGATALV